MSAMTDNQFNKTRQAANDAWDHNTVRRAVKGVGSATAIIVAGPAAGTAVAGAAAYGEYRRRYDQGPEEGGGGDQ
jgi:hypothetical protein